MLSAHQINQTYGIHTGLQDINFSLHTGKSPGLVGAYDFGVTTLLRILAGQEQPGAGMVARTHPAVQIGFTCCSLSEMEVCIYGVSLC